MRGSGHVGSLLRNRPFMLCVPAALHLPLLHAFQSFSELFRAHYGTISLAHATTAPLPLPTKESQAPGRGPCIRARI